MITAEGCQAEQVLRIKEKTEWAILEGLLEIRGTRESIISHGGLLTRELELWIEWKKMAQQSKNVSSINEIVDEVFALLQMANGSQNPHLAFSEIPQC